MPSSLATTRSRLCVIAAAVGVAAALQVIWLFFIATPGGDLAAQDAWAEFARRYPGSAYNFAWYGGMHPVSYSVIAPFVMAELGVRTTMVITSVVAAALLAWLVTERLGRDRGVWVVVVAGAFALLGNAVSGRVTFALGTTVALAAACVVLAWPTSWRWSAVVTRRVRGVLTVVLAGLATACSPVAGLFLGVLAATLWLRGRRLVSLAVGLPPVAVVLGSAVLFPFSGLQPMAFGSVVLSVTIGLAVVCLVPRDWREVRLSAGIYLAMVLFAWLVPTPIGSNVTRLSLLFGGVILIAAAGGGRWKRSAVSRRLGRPVALVALVLTIGTSLGWQAAIAVNDVVGTRPPATMEADVPALVARLQSLGATAGRIEVVPTRSHLEAAALAPEVALARGWNRQADVERNPIFYTGDLTSAQYRDWLQRWAVGYVVVAVGATPDHGAVEEAALVAAGQPYLTQVWVDQNWIVYAVNDPAPLIRPAGAVNSLSADELVVTVPAAGRYVIKVASSPWLNVIERDGQPSLTACVTDLVAENPTQTTEPIDNWVVLRASAAGTYRIAAPYRLHRGSRCVD